jgi:general secretion pathway protein K
VLWLLVGLSAVGVHAALETRTERLASANLLDQARSREIALAGSEYARSRLTAALLDRAEQLRSEVQSSQNRSGGGGRSRTQSVQSMFRNSDPIDDPWTDPAGLVVQEMVLGDARFTLYLRDADAALNPNGADAEMLTNFFSQGLGLDYAAADRLAQAILDWQDEDELPRVGGAEAEEYMDAGAAILPPNRPFGRLDELRYVLGMTQQIFDAAAPHLTLLSSGRINVNAAPVEVLLAAPGMTPTIAQEIQQLRNTGYYARNLEQLLAGLSPSSRGQLSVVQRRLNARLSFRTDQVEIVSEGGVEGSSIRSRVRMVVGQRIQTEGGVANVGAVILAKEID